MAREQFQSLTEQMYYILLALTEERCGVDISRQVGEISGDRIQIGPGTLYALLEKFKVSGMIAETAMEGRKRFYKITPYGRRVLKEEYERLKKLVEEGKPYVEL
ncbi:PadR family transcriptional regulator [Clostridium sp. MCC353]|uniref:PadR family transcriptional regulator n=1 Tax=Clostridium sp. MCC353 TaxID=2592646 RepID=UPI001C030AFF|nr:helix-turn-helix transcriptional regulator [Clostridium sp. MCC353]MBT9778019.1 PadR family transcriptional regulator [Clostridium sp. MCC353]